MNITDILVVAIIGLCAARGASRGFWLTALRLAGGLGAVAFTWVAQPGFKMWLTGEGKPLEAFQQSMLEPLLSAVPSEFPQEKLLQLANLLDRSEIPGFLKKMMLTTVDTTSGSMVSISDAAMTLICYVVLLLISTVVIQGVGLFIDSVFKLPGLSILNRGVGTVVGVTEGVILVWVLMALLTPWVAFRPDGVISQAVGASTIGSWMFHNNVLLALIKFK